MFAQYLNLDKVVNSRLDNFSYSTYRAKRNRSLRSKFKSD